MARRKPKTSGKTLKGVSRSASKLASSAAPKPRKRNYRAEYARRQQLAKQRGFESYYAQRVRGGAGAKPSDPLPSDPGEFRRRRGHAGRSAMLREIKPESHVTVGDNLGTLTKNAQGNYERIPITVSAPDGTETDYWLTNMSDEELAWFIGELDDLDVSYSPDYDLRNL